MSFSAVPTWRCEVLPRASNPRCAEWCCWEGLQRREASPTQITKQAPMRPAQSPPTWPTVVRRPKSDPQEETLKSRNCSGTPQNRCVATGGLFPITFDSSPRFGRMCGGLPVGTASRIAPHTFPTFPRNNFYFTVVSPARKVKCSELSMWLGGQKPHRKPVSNATTVLTQRGDLPDVNLFAASLDCILAQAYEIMYQECDKQTPWCGRASAEKLGGSSESSTIAARR